MANDPAFLFYTNDFDSKTKFFTDAQVGKYLRLLMAQHQHGHLTEKQVLYICSTYDVDVMAKFTKDENGLYYNERLENEINKRKKYSESRRTNIKKRYDADNKQPKNKKKKSTHVPTHVVHMENENEIEKENETVFVFPFESQKFKDAWGILVKEPKWRKKTVSAIQASLKKLGQYPEEVAVKMIEDCIAGGWQGLVEPKNNYNATNFGTNGTGGQKLGTSAARIEALKRW